MLTRLTHSYSVVRQPRVTRFDLHAVLLWPCIQVIAINSDQKASVSFFCITSNLLVLDNINFQRDERGGNSLS